MALDYNIIGERLKNARKSKKLTQEQLAEKLEVSVAFISRIERGSSHISLKRLNEICDILEITEGSILNGSSNTGSNYLSEEFNEIIENSNPKSQKLIYKIAKVINEENISED